MDLKSTDIVLDLFCGLGNFSLPMAKFCSKVIGVEGSTMMVERGALNAARNKLTNVTFYAANLDDANAVKKVVQHECNKVLIDPPRSGALELVKQIDVLNPERIVYVSCNPVTLARDTDILVNQKGYILVNAGVMDMFPHTTHVEIDSSLCKRIKSMVRVKDTTPLNPDGSIDMALWLHQLSSKGYLEHLNLIRNTCTLSQLTGLDHATETGQTCLQQGLAMADLLADLEVDPETIAAAIICENVHYAGLSIDDVEEQLGINIAKLVRGIEKNERT